jgi:hypothetical protein
MKIVDLLRKAEKIEAVQKTTYYYFLCCAVWINGSTLFFAS